MKILIIEDERALVKNITQYLRNDGYVCDIAYTGLEAIEKILMHTYDCILVDVSLPENNGFAVIDTLRRYNKAGSVILIAGADHPTEQIPGFDSKEDYLVKPFPMPQLADRVAANIRRQKFGSYARLEFDTIAIDLLGKTVSIHDNEVRLTRKEFDLLVFLAANKNRVLTKNAIAEHLTGDGEEAINNFDFLYSHMKNLKKKLVDAGGKNYIRTMYGIGYKFSG